MKATHMTITGALAIAGALTGLYTSGIWDQVGWQTPAAHAADYQQTVEQIKDFRDEWKCDEYDEELLKLKLYVQNMKLNGEDTTEIELLIEKIERKMEALECERFDDFG